MQNRTPEVPAPARATGLPGEVFYSALKLGLTSFGGPIAHLGYFERTYVRKRRWLTREEYAGLIALCQLLPGPTSSQVGFLIGLRRAGWRGALCAWAGFTLPSAVLMYAFALLAPQARGVRLQAILHGLMLTAVVVVAQALWSMARQLCPDRRRMIIAVLAAALVLAHQSEALQLAAMLGGAIGGWILCRTGSAPEVTLFARSESRAAWAALAIFAALLLSLPLLAALAPHGPIALASIFYRAGALVFGGGHVVLPLLLQALVPGGWVSDGEFLSGYGLAQAMPGPLFSVADYLGATAAPARASALWATIALIAIFLPGMLLAIAGVALWNRLVRIAAARAMLAGINAAVVGILAAALYDPVCTSAIRRGTDVVVAICGFVLMQRWSAPPILVLALCVLASVGMAAAS
jgi:chromate transporter